MDLVFLIGKNETEQAVLVLSVNCCHKKNPPFLVNPVVYEINPSIHSIVAGKGFCKAENAERDRGNALSGSVISIKHNREYMPKRQ